jgi:hypothetical protein
MIEATLGTNAEGEPFLCVPKNDRAGWANSRDDRSEALEGEIEQTPGRDERRPTPDRLRPRASNAPIDPRAGAIADIGPAHDGD